MRSTLLLLALALASLAQATHVRVYGTVTGHESRTPLEGALVRVYKDGVKQLAFTTGAGGRYSVVLENNAHYIIRFSQQGRVTKCYAVNTIGPEWEGDERITDVEVEMTLFERVAGLDLAFFDLPMGIARFTPMTGVIAWNKEYELRIQPEAERLMAEVALRRSTLAVTAQREPAGVLRH